MTPAPYFQDVTDDVEGVGHFLRAADGCQIRVVIWPREAARGTIVIFPGRTEYCEKYAREIPVFHAAGFAVSAVDWRGQGLADRLTKDRRAGHIDDFAQFQLDADAYLDLLRAQGLPEPFYLLAHSMGGCIGLRRLQGAHPFKRAVFSAPMWGLALPLVLRPVAWALPRLASLLGASHRFAPGMDGQSLFDKPFEDNLLTTDPESWSWIGAQTRAHPDLILGGPTMGWLHAAQLEMAALARLPNPDLPALTLLGGDEKVVSPAAIRTRMAQWPDGQVLDLPGLRHETLMESEATRGPILDKIIAHLA